MGVSELEKHSGQYYISEKRAWKRVEELQRQFATQLAESSLMFALSGVENVPLDDVADLNEELDARRSEDEILSSFPELQAFVAECRRITADTERVYTEEHDRLNKLAGNAVPKRSPNAVARAVKIVLCPQPSYLTLPSGRRIVK